MIPYMYVHGRFAENITDYFRTKIQLIDTNLVIDRVGLRTMSMSIHNGQGKKGCGVRDKYTKSWKDRGELTVFQLYTTYSKPGLVSIFSYDDQRSFHNWGFEVENTFD